jgi:23S rRNA (adenine2503-C2)-methyltransferase
MLALQSITPERLASAVPQVSLAEARKLIAQVHRGEPIVATSAIRRASAEAVRAVASVPALDVIAETPSHIDPFVKYLLAAPDGARFEAVRIPLERRDRFCVCVSSQVGCALACSFCATGRLGLTRNLAAWEIVEQVRIVRARLPIDRVRAARLPIDRADSDEHRGPRGNDTDELRRPRVHGVVFQGMGEPLANLDEVLAAIEVLTEPCALGIDARAITVCTAGLPVGIRKLAAEAPKVRLGLSIHTALPERRKSLMPIARAHDLDDVLAAAADHARITGLAPMWAVTLLDGINDSDDDARALAARARTFADDTGVLPRISVIAYNAIGDDDPYRRSPRDAQYRAALGVPSHRRYSGGSDVGAACGQLALRT